MVVPVLSFVACIERVEMLAYRRSPGRQPRRRRLMVNNKSRGFSLRTCDFLHRHKVSGDPCHPLSAAIVGKEKKWYDPQAG